MSLRLDLPIHLYNVFLIHSYASSYMLQTICYIIVLDNILDNSGSPDGLSWTGQSVCGDD